MHDDDAEEEEEEEEELTPLVGLSRTNVKLKTLKQT